MATPVSITPANMAITFILLSIAHLLFLLNVGTPCDDNPLNGRLRDLLENIRGKEIMLLELSKSGRTCGK